jgi:predicted dithiol-disulfide oxidoreductase (DUF899 family)
MMGPGQKHQCVGCSLEVDHVQGILEHLENHDVSYVTVARAPIEEIEEVRPGLEDLSGDSVFFKDDAGQVFHTYSSNGRWGEAFLRIYRFLDRMPKGREENGPHHSLADWARPRNMYGAAGMVAGNGRFHEAACACAVHK